ncbi:hypothetical protein RRG08_020233 [Elysia crispata]|uniref:Uncharacterized protein n=1 Tax=Elysia crispata TaxID=231223 RepID=A0AAE1A234_9GAST|nr:hypothetical protein RRG08_020233 [Elysia crispata]
MSSRKCPSSVSRLPEDARLCAGPGSTMGESLAVCRVSGHWTGRVYLGQVWGGMESKPQPQRDGSTWRSVHVNLVSDCGHLVIGLFHDGAFVRTPHFGDKLTIYCDKTDRAGRHWN